MSERITEAELQRIEGAAEDWRNVECSYCNRSAMVPPNLAVYSCECVPTAGLVRHVTLTPTGPTQRGRLVAEVRRLRALIVAMAGVQIDGTICDPHREGRAYCVSCGYQHDYEACPTKDLENEARAIRDEQPLDRPGQIPGSPR